VGVLLAISCFNLYNDFERNRLNHAMTKIFWKQYGLGKAGWPFHPLQNIFMPFHSCSLLNFPSSVGLSGASWASLTFFTMEAARGLCRCWNLWRFVQVEVSLQLWDMVSPCHLSSHSEFKFLSWMG
jgi:hypothetical protein